MEPSLGVRGQLILLLVIVFFFFFFVVLLNVNDGNILTDRTNERKYLQRKYNDL